MRFSFEDFLKEQGFQAEAVEFAMRRLVDSTTPPVNKEVYRDAVRRLEDQSATLVRSEKQHLLP